MINSPIEHAETSIFCLQNDATVRRTVTTFVCPQTQFHENLHTNFVLQNLPNNCNPHDSVSQRRLIPADAEEWHLFKYRR